MASGKKTDKFSSFAYIATNPTTGVVRGELRASGQDSALIQLERMGLEPISVSEKKQSLLDMEINLFEKVLVTAKRAKTISEMEEAEKLDLEHTPTFQAILETTEGRIRYQRPISEDED